MLKRIILLFICTGSCLFFKNDVQAQLTLFKDIKTCLYGYTNDSGKWIVQPQYLHAEEFYGGYAIVGINERKGLLDTIGNVIVPLQYDYIIRENGWYVLKHDTVYDVFDPVSKKIMIKDFPHMIIAYEKEYVLFKNQDSYGLAAGNKILLENSIRIDINPHDQSAIVHYGPAYSDSIRIYFIQQRTFAPDTYSYLHWTDSNHYLAKKGNAYGLIDHTGKTIVSFDYTDIYLSDAENAPLVLQKKHNKGYDVFTIAGRKLNKKAYQQIDTASLLQYSIYIVTQKLKQGVLNTDGKLKIPCVYDSISYVLAGDYPAYLLHSPKGIQVANTAGNILHNGHYENIALLKPLYAPEPEYSYEEPLPPYIISILPDTSFIVLNVRDSTEYRSAAGEYADASYLLYSKGKYGMISGGLQQVVPPVYDFIFPFQSEHSYTTILQQGRFGILDLYGDVIIPPEYLFIGENPLSDESFIFMTEDYLFGIKNTAGEILVEPVYTALSGYDPEKDYCWAKHADSSELRLINRNGSLKSPLDFAYPINLASSGGVVIQSTTEDLYNETYKTGVLDCNTFQPVVPFSYALIVPVNDSIYLCTTEESYTDSTYTDLYIQQMHLDSVTGCALLPDQIIAIERCYSWGYFKNGKWLVKPGTKPDVYGAEIRELLHIQSQTINSYMSDLYGGEYEITLAFDSTHIHTALSKLLNYELIQSFSNDQKRTFNNLYIEEDMENRLVLYDRDYVDILIQSAYEPDEEMYYGYRNGYASGGSETITAVVHTSSFGEIRSYSESWERASYYVHHENILYTITSNNQLKQLSLADVTNHLQHTAILSSLINLQLDSMENIQLSCTDREQIVELATGYQFEKEGLLFYFEDERSQNSYEYEEIEVLLPYSQIILYFKKSAYITELYKNSLK